MNNKNIVFIYRLLNWTCSQLAIQTLQHHLSSVSIAKFEYIELDTQFIHLNFQNVIVCWVVLSSENFFLSFFRSSHPGVFCKKGVLRNFAKFTGKHLCQCLWIPLVVASIFYTFFAAINPFCKKMLLCAIMKFLFATKWL